MSLPAPVLDLPRRRSLPHAALLALRPRQWTKNLLLFAGIIFAAKLGDASRWGEAVAAFVAYCAASSASYLVIVVRAAAGAAAVEVRISPWLLLCTALLALFLALAKRRGELVLVGAEATPGRP